MDRRIIWTEIALSDLQQIVDYIAKDSNRYAAAVARQVRDASRSLRRLADRGRIVPELGRSQIREVFVRSYRLVYSVSTENVHILGVIHGARDFATLWDREERPRD